MKVLIQTLDKGNKSIEVDQNGTIEDLKVMIEVELGIPFLSQQLFFGNNRLMDQRSLMSYNILENTALQLRTTNQQQQPSYNTNNQFQQILRNTFKNVNQQMQTTPAQIKNANLMNEAIQLKQYFNSNPEQLNMILHQNRELAEAVLAEDNNILMQYLQAQKHRKAQEQLQQMQEIQKLNADPFDMDAQAKIEQAIHQENIDQNLDFAQEYIPESFAKVCMLYVEISINNHPIQAFVDSGAQSTIMSKKCAERCGIMRLIDKRFKGIAMGVGTSTITGKIHAVQMQIADKFFSCSLTILEDDKIEFLLGLDMLKRHQCCIDLHKNVLSFDSGAVSVPFLPEQKIIKSFSENAQELYEKEMNQKNQGQQPQQNQQLIDANINSFPEDTVLNLMGLGCTREQAINALKSTNGNAELAASLLFNNF